MEALWHITTLLGQATHAIHAAAQPAVDPVVAPATHPSETFDLADGLAALWMIAAAVAIFRLVIVRPRSVLGPQRLGDGQHVGLLLVSFALGFMTWLLTQAAYQSHVLAKLKRAEIPDAQSHLEEYLKPHDLAVLGTLPFVLGFMVMLIALRLSPDIIRQLGLRLGGILRGIGAGVLTFLVIFPCVVWAGAALELLYKRIGFIHPTEHVMLKDLGQTTNRGVAALLIVGATICAPLFEELLFRGHVQTLLRRFFVQCSIWWSPQGAGELGSGGAPSPLPLPVLGESAGVRGPLLPPLEYQPNPVALQTPAPPLPNKSWHSWAAIIITSALFALVHPLWMAPLIFILALGLGYIYERTGILWASITVHVLFNSMETLQYYLLFMHH